MTRSSTVLTSRMTWMRCITRDAGALVKKRYTFYGWSLMMSGLNEHSEVSRNFSQAFAEPHHGSVGLLPHLVVFTMNWMYGIQHWCVWKQTRQAVRHHQTPIVSTYRCHLLRSLRFQQFGSHEGWAPLHRQRRWESSSIRTRRLARRSAHTQCHGGHRDQW